MTLVKMTAKLSGEMALVLQRTLIWLTVEMPSTEATGPENSFMLCQTARIPSNEDNGLVVAFTVVSFNFKNTISRRQWSCNNFCML